MAIEAYITEKSLGTSTGDITITVPGFGTPQLVMFIANTSPSTEYLDTLYSSNSKMFRLIGYTDGINEFACAATHSRSGSEFSTTSRLSKIHCVYLRDGGDTNAITGAFKEWTTDGLTITIDKNTLADGPYTVTAVFFKGFDNVAVGCVYVDNDGYNELDIPVNVGFEPSVACLISEHTSELQDYGTNRWLIGYAINDDPIIQSSSMIFESGGNIPGAYMTNSHALAWFYSNSAGANNDANITAFDATSFTITNNAYVDSQNSYWPARWSGYVALRTTESIYAQCVLTESVTGEDLLSEIGFKPTFIFTVLQSHVNALDTNFYWADTNQAAGHVYAISAPNATRAFISSSCADDANDVCIIRNIVRSDAFFCVESYNNISETFDQYLIETELLSREATGIQLNYTAAAARYVGKFAIGDYVPPQFHPVDKAEAVVVNESITLLREIFGSVTCGHVTDVVEDNVLPFAPFFTGTAQAKNTGDSEVLVFGDDDYAESETFELGEGDCKIDQNKYGTGGEGTLYYRTAATRTACDAAGWTAYTGTFTSLGFVGVKVVKEV